MNRQRYVRVIRQADKHRDRQIGRQAERQTDIEIVERTDINSFDSSKDKLHTKGICFITSKTDT